MYIEERDMELYASRIKEIVLLLTFHFNTKRKTWKEIKPCQAK